MSLEIESLNKTSPAATNKFSFFISLATNRRFLLVSLCTSIITSIIGFSIHASLLFKPNFAGFVYPQSRSFMLALSVMFFCVEGAILQFRFLVFALYFRFVSTAIDNRAALKMSCLQASTDALLFLRLLYCMSPPLTFKLIVRIYLMARKGTASCPFFCCS
jgi:hypothetical protein